MKRLGLLVLMAIVASATIAASAAASAASRHHRLADLGESSINLVLAGSPGDDHITIELSNDGRYYEIESAAPLEVGGSVCAHPEKQEDELLCEASPIAGFEINTGAGEDFVMLGRTVPVPATIRGGEGDDVLVGGAGADKLIGGPGDDELIGRGGDDLLIGGPGADKLHGGPGRNILRP